MVLEIEIKEDIKNKQDESYQKKRRNYAKAKKLIVSLNNLFPHVFSPPLSNSTVV